MLPRSAPFGQLLRGHRQAAGLTQEMLAEKAGISVRTISDLERGLFQRPHATTVRLLAAALELSPEAMADLEGAARPGSQGPDRPHLREEAGPEWPSLPEQPTPFIGRERETEAVLEIVRRPDARLITLSGPGGTGKTRLALHVASLIAAGYGNGVFFVPLAPVAEPHLVASAIAAAVSIPEESSEPVAQALIRHLRGRRLLLILDNFEHLIGAAPLVADIVGTCPGLTILVTSRTVLHLAWEHVFSVPPLLLPDLGNLPPTQILGGNDAVALFVRRARAANASFRLTDQNARAVVEICYRLDGLPLAIELAAAWTRLFSPRALLAKLSNQLAILQGASHGRPARHHTLRAAIDWSDSLLSPEERTFFARLSIFAGGWALEAAEATCTGESTIDALQATASLVDKSLIVAVDADDAEPRFTMLETIREYAAEKLEGIGEAQTLRASHAAYYLAYAEAAEKELDGPAGGEWTTRLDADLDNLRAALTYFLNSGENERELCLTVALFQYWYARGYWSEGRRWLEAGLADADGVSPRTRARALFCLGTAASDIGDQERAVVLLEQSLQLLQELGEDSWMAEALNGLGNIANLQGDDERARALYEQSLQIATAIGNRGLQGQALFNLGSIAGSRGDFATAREHYEQMLAIARAMDDGEGVAAGLCNSGWIAYREGRLDEAEALFEESLAQTRTQPLVAHVLGDLANVAVARGHLDLARERLHESILLAQELGDRNLQLLLLGNIARLRLASGNPNEALHAKGAESAARERLTIPLPPVDATDEEAMLSHLKTLLSEDQFTAAWNHGRAMGLEEAIAGALKDHPDAPLRILYRQVQ